WIPRLQIPNGRPDPSVEMAHLPTQPDAFRHKTQRHRGFRPTVRLAAIPKGSQRVAGAPSEARPPERWKIETRPRQGSQRVMHRNERDRPKQCEWTIQLL